MASGVWSKEEEEEDDDEEEGLDSRDVQLCLLQHRKGGEYSLTQLLKILATCHQLRQ